MVRTTENSTVVPVESFDGLANLVSDQHAVDVIDWINEHTEGDVEIKPSVTQWADIYFELPHDATLFILRWAS
jgi:hypothetical protein